MITSLIHRDVKVTPVDLAKEIVSMYGRNGLPSVRTTLREGGVDVTEKELALVHKHCLTIYTRLLKMMGLEVIEVEILLTLFPLETK